MIGRTLAFYFARRFTRHGAGDLPVLPVPDHARSPISSSSTGRCAPTSSTASRSLLLSIYRVPSICEDILPFTTLFGSIAAFVLANRRLEVVIARAAGVSAWQFLLPACIVGLLVGIVATTVYNPISTELRTCRTRSRQVLTEKRSDDDQAARSGSGRPPKAANRSSARSRRPTTA